MVKRSVIIGSVIAAVVVLSGLGVLIWWLVTDEVEADTPEVPESDAFVVNREYVLSIQSQTTFFFQNASR